jgi:hypothetical protein
LLAGTSEPDSVYRDTSAYCSRVDSIADGDDFASNFVAGGHGVGVRATGIHEQV